MTHEDFEFYSNQVNKMEARYTLLFGRMGIRGAEDFFGRIQEELSMSLLWYWEFMIGFGDDIKAASLAPKGTNRKLMLERLAGQRVYRITKTFRSLAGYVSML